MGVNQNDNRIQELEKATGCVRETVSSHGARLDGHDKEIASKVSNHAFLPVKLVVYGAVAALLGLAFKILQGGMKQ